MKNAGVDRAVLVPPLWDPNGNAYALSLTRKFPEKFCVMGLLDPRQPDAAAQLYGYAQEAGMRGVRFLLNTAERIQPYEDGCMDDLWPVAEDLGLPVALLIPGRLEVAAHVARKYPRLKIIVDHLGVPRASLGEMAFKHLPELLRLADLPNIHVKAAGVGDYALDPFPFSSLDAPLQAIFSAFGSERVMWGSDLSRLHHPYAHCVEHFKSHLAFLSPTDVERVMGKNILELLQWS